MCYKWIITEPLWMVTIIRFGGVHMSKENIVLILGHRAICGISFTNYELGISWNFGKLLFLWICFLLLLSFYPYLIEVHNLILWKLSFFPCYCFNQYLHFLFISLWYNQIIYLFVSNLHLHLLNFLTWACT